jgi:cation:H+ antiporter
MIVQILILVAGLALVVWGADALVDGASAVARRFGLSEFIIGLTIVGMGTSAPEMVVSFIGAAEGNADISLGNVVGSNVFNTLLILGITALLLPMPVTPENRKKDIPMNIVITLLLIGLGLEHTLFGFGTDGLSRWDGLVLVAVFALYIGRSFRQGAGKEETSEAEKMPLWKAALWIVLGLTALILGGNWFVDSATFIAKALGVSDKFIAITILAGGTSMPELATCVAAAVKKKGQLALGNIIGSNIFNILLILGGAAIIHPLSFEGITYVDLGALIVSALALLTSSYVGKKNMLDKVDGVLFLLLFAGYMSYLIINL